MPGNPNNPLLQKSILSEPGSVPLQGSAGNGSEDEILILEDFGPKLKLDSHSPPGKTQSAEEGQQSESDDEPELMDLDPPPQNNQNVRLTKEMSFQRSVNAFEDFRTSLMELRMTLEKEEELRFEELENLKKKGEIAMEDYNSEVERVNSYKRKRSSLYMSFSTSMQLLKDGLDILF